MDAARGCRAPPQRGGAHSREPRKREPPRVGDLDRSLDGTAAEGRARGQPHVAKAAGAAAELCLPSLDVGVKGADGEETYRATYLP